jgi:hypothetical protein
MPGDKCRWRAAAVRAVQRRGTAAPGIRAARVSGFGFCSVDFPPFCLHIEAACLPMHMWILRLAAVGGARGEVWWDVSAQPAEACLATDADGVPLLCVLCRGASPQLMGVRLPE